MRIDSDAYRKTDAATEPVSLVEAKTHLRVDSIADDTYITNLIKTARRVCENYANRAFITQTWVKSLTDFERVIYLPRPPLISVSSFKYTNSAGTVITLTENTDFVVNKKVQPALIYFPRWVNAPSLDYVVSYSDGYPIEIEYTCGYGDAAAVPAEIKQAILLTIGHYYENREDSVVGAGFTANKLPMGARALLAMDGIVSI
jgi:uncharacterized phiE125 gp8 family phage protein